MYVPSRRGEDVEIFFEDLPPSWKLTAELPLGSGASSFRAENYDALVDAPVEAGRFEEFAFDSESAHFRVIVDGAESNKGQLENLLRRIVKYELNLMKGPPFKEYAFLVHIGSYAEVGSGGMEHANSTAVAAARCKAGSSVVYTR